MSNVEYKCAKTAHTEPEPASKFTKTNIDSASLEAALEPGPVEVGLGWVDLPFSLSLLEWVCCPV